MPPQISSNELQNFRNSVDAIFKNWTALQLAVSQGAGGPQSKAIADWMADAVVQWFGENQNLEAYEVTEFLENIVNQEFNLIVDDGSADEIGTTICEFYQLCTSSKSNTDILAKIHSLPKCDLSKCKVEGQSQEDEAASLDENMLEEKLNDMEVDLDDQHTSSNAASEAQESSKTEPDPDGWVTVGRKKK